MIEINSTRSHLTEQELLNGQSSLTAVRYFLETKSTMEDARAILSEISQNDFALVMANTQTAARGRQGKKWLSAKEGFWGTFVFHNPLGLEALTGFSLVVGCVVHRVCKTLRVDTFLKWPNDVYSSKGDKLAGLLVEIVTHAGQSWLLCGIGLNIAGEPKEHFSPASISLQSLDASCLDSLFIAKLLASELNSAWRQFQISGFKAFKSEWLAAAYRLNSLVEIDQAISGKFVGLGDNGSLLLETIQGPKEINSGTLRFVEQLK